MAKLPTVFKTVAAATKFIASKSENGMEHCINDSIHFGVSASAYAYSSDVKEAGLSAQPNAFTHLDNAALVEILNYHLKQNGYLYLSF